MKTDTLATLRRRGIPILGGTLLLLLVAYILVAFLMVRAATSAERKPFEAVPSDFGVSYQDVSFEPRGGGPLLRGWYMQSEPDAPVVIFVNGIDSQRSGDGAVDLGSRLVRVGFSVLLFDLRGHGESDASRVSGGYFERRDVLGAYDYVVAQGARPGNIGLVGFSMGGGIALMTAAQEPGIAAVVSDSAFADIRDLLVEETARRTPIPRFIVPVFVPPAKLFANVLYGIDFGELVPEDSVAQLSYPLFMIHGEEDDRIPVSHARRIYDNAPASSELWIVPDVGHTDAFGAMPEAYARRVVTYLSARFQAD
jgi:pimeloyl-ACP methyl ester carboxylesterase